MTRRLRLVLIAIGFTSVAAAMILGASRSIAGGPTWWQICVLLTAMVLYIAWRTVSIARAEVAGSVAKFGSVGGVWCRLLNDKVDQWGSLVVTRDSIVWNPTARAVASGCVVERFQRHEFERLEVAPVTRGVRRLSAVTVMTPHEPRVTLVMTKQALDRLAELASTCSFAVRAKT